MISNDGVTESEKFLGSLCRKTFLSIWSHQNLYNDRGRNSKNRQGKELCDLLVIFGNDIVIFSDKRCSYPDTGNAALDWSRWYKKTIKESADQIFGAEKWIREFPQRVFLDKFCEEKFPYDLPQPDAMRVHRVVVALGAGERAASYFGGNSTGSLLLETHIVDSAHVGDAARPFRVGHVDKSRGYVHVFDDHTLPIILKELDTVYDFIEYLRSKEDFLSSVKNVFIAGEEELLAFYLDSTVQHGSFPPDEIRRAIKENKSDAIQIPEGFWADYQQGPLSKIHREIRKDSVFYDNLIEHFASHLRAGTLAYGSDDYRSHEKNLRFLASEPRASRFAMTVAWQQKLLTTPRNLQTSISIPSKWTGNLVILILFPRSIGQSDKDYRRERQDMLTSYALVARRKYPVHRFIVCLGIEPGSMRVRRSEDLMSFDFEDWSEEEDNAAAKIQAELNILTDVQERHTFDPPNIRRGDLGSGNRAERRKQRSIAKRKR